MEITDRIISEKVLTTLQSGIVFRTYRDDSGRLFPTVIVKGRVMPYRMFIGFAVGFFTCVGAGARYKEENDAELAILGETSNLAISNCKKAADEFLEEFIKVPKDEKFGLEDLIDLAGQLEEEFRVSIDDPIDINQATGLKGIASISRHGLRSTEDEAVALPEWPIE